MRELERTFENQGGDSLSRKFWSSKDHKKFFVENDALHNLEEDLVYTVLGRYTCKSGCKVCFLNGHWLRDEDLSSYIPGPDEITDAYKKELRELFSYYHRVACVDDLVFLKRFHPHLYDFYREMAPLMEFHTTDNSFFSHYKILMEEVHFKDIGQISFSDELLSKKNGTIVDDIIEKLSLLNDRSPITRVNFIITQKKPKDNPHVMKLCKWLTEIDETLAIYFHSDVRVEEDLVGEMRESGYSEPSCYHIEHSTNPPTKCDLVTETVHLRFKDFFVDLSSSMNLNERPFYTMEKGFNVDQFLLSVLKEKVRIYNRNHSIMSKNNSLKDYFGDISKELAIHEDFNFIPSVVLSPMSHMYKKLSEKEFTNTYAGLVKKGTKSVKPIFTFGDNVG